MFGFHMHKRVAEVARSETGKSAVEIVVNKAAKKEAVEEAKKANEQLNRLLAQNGFTLKIYLATLEHSPEDKK